MTRIDIKHIPFAMAMLPFLAAGITLPVTILDWLHRSLLESEALFLGIGVFIIGVWECMIICSVRSKKRLGKGYLLGHRLNSWIWAPPLTFIVGVALGRVFIPS